MKKLSFLNKIVYLFNNIFALLLFLSITIPYIKPQSFPLISILSLTVPILIFSHLIFIVYWILSGVKKQFILSALCILLTIFFSYFPYKFNGKIIKEDNSFTIMNYNVHLFNVYGSLENDSIPLKISEFVSQNNPDIITFQEYADEEINLFDFPYKYIELGHKKKFGQAIFSKYRIIKKGSLQFENSFNNAIFVDIIKQNDTIRIYNLHLESFGIEIENINLNENESKRILHRLSKSFGKQQGQVEKFISHRENCNYKIITCGDFNNTAYSWAYRNIRGNSNDTFLEAGKGFGETYTFQHYPLRIDFILVDKKIKVNEHRNFKVNLSDHEPILAKLSL